MSRHDPKVTLRQLAEHAQQAQELCARNTFSENWRELQDILNRMQVLSRSIIFATLPDTRRRKRLSRKVLGLN